MVSRAGRELLKNTIRTVDHHNRILEEKIMWNLHRKKFGNSSNDEEISSKKRKRTKKQKLKTFKRKSNLSNVLEKNLAKWDHSGFLELYPEVAVSKEKSQPEAKKQKEKKKKKKKRRKEIQSPSQSSDTSVEEVWVEKTSQDSQH